MLTSGVLNAGDSAPRAGGGKSSCPEGGAGGITWGATGSTCARAGIGFEGEDGLSTVGAGAGGIGASAWLTGCRTCGEITSGPWGILSALRLDISRSGDSGVFGSSERTAVGMDTASAGPATAAMGWMAMNGAGLRSAASPERAGPAAAIG